MPFWTLHTDNMTICPLFLGDDSCLQVTFLLSPVPLVPSISCRTIDGSSRYYFVIICAVRDWKTLKASPLSSRGSERPTDRTWEGTSTPKGSPYRRCWGTLSECYPLPCLLSAGRTDPRLLRGDAFSVIITMTCYPRSYRPHGYWEATLSASFNRSTKNFSKNLVYTRELSILQGWIPLTSGRKVKLVGLVFICAYNLSSGKVCNFSFSLISHLDAIILYLLYDLSFVYAKLRNNPDSAKQINGKVGK